MALTGCSSNLKLSVYKPEVKAGPIGKAGVVALDGSAYPMYHTIHALKNVNFAQLCEEALEEAIHSTRKNWKLIYPAAIQAASPDIAGICAVRKEMFQEATPDEKAAMHSCAKLLETRYFFVIESIAIKDVSTPQVPASFVLGACVQLWDFEKGQVVFRARSVSSTMNYVKDELRKELKSPIADLLADLISPLPKE